MSSLTEKNALGGTNPYRTTVARVIPDESTIDVVDGQKPVVPENCVAAEPVDLKRSSEASASVSLLRSADPGRTEEAALASEGC